jgi:CDP-diacylglycerol---glycerol-3-phosphate 3-phosphatidyltransferase
MMTLPNILTLVRIALIPFFAVCFHLPFAGASITAAAVFGIAALTDWADGFLARRLNQTSRFGAFLDPVADKLMVVVVLVILLEANPSLWLGLPVAVIIGREIAVSALREWMAEIGARKKIAVSSLGKVKTVLQMSALVLLIIGAGDQAPAWFHWVGMALLYVAMIMTLWSMLAYLVLAWPDLKEP